jgi:ATP-dependent helicase/nuclease subunit B
VSIDLTWLPYGRPAAEALRSAIVRAKGDEPLAPVGVVVPSNYVGVATRRLLASGELGPTCHKGTGMAAVSFVTVYRLAELLGAARLAASGRRPVSTPVIAAAMRSALTQGPGMFAPVAGHAATEAALVSAYRELRDLSDGALDALAGRSARARDVVRLHRAARSLLAPTFYDEEDLLEAAADAVRTDTVAGGRLGAVIAYLPERLSRHGGELLAAIAGTSELIVLAGTTADARADADVDRSVHRMGAGAAETRPRDDRPRGVVEGVRTQIVTASDCDDEVRAAVRAIVDAARAGTPLDRVAVLHASPEPYARLVQEQFAAAGIAFNGAAAMPPTARVVGRTMLGLLALPEGGYRRGEVFAWLAGGPLRHEGRPIPVGAWERLSRDAGVVAGRFDWDRRLAVLSDAREAQAELAEHDPDASPWRSDRLRTDAAQARALRAFVLGLIDDLDHAAAGPQPWGERAAWARRHLGELFGDEGRRAGWPLSEQKAADRVDRALDRLSCLDAVEYAVDLDVFSSSLRLELETDLGRVGRMGEGVLVGSVSMGVGLDLDLVVVLGLAEGLFPSPTDDDSLLPDHERTSAGDELPLRSEGVERQHRQLLAALAGASRRLLCVPRGDLRRNIERVPSRWLLQIASVMADDGERWSSDDILRAEGDWLTHVASFDAGIRRTDFPATEQEHRLRSLMARGSTGLSPAVLIATGDASLTAGAEVVAARRSARFTRFDGNLAGLHPPSPAERVTSATRLEGWARCPFAYFVRDVLGVDEVENPEDELQMTARDKGSLVHQALEEFIAQVLTRPPSGQPGPGEPWTDSDRALMVEIAEKVCDGYEAQGLAGRPIFWRQDKKRIIADLIKFLQVDTDYRSVHGTRPMAAELAFGLPRAKVGAVSLAIAGGRRVRFRGKADRVDLGADGSLHVVDYKTGRGDAYKDVSEDNPDARGRRLQLAVYAQAARLLRGDPDAVVRADYWFVSTLGRFERVGYPVTQAVLAHVGESLGAMVDAIEAGVFPSHPTASSTTPWVECPYCDPDGMGVTELRRLYERKQADPAMAPFVSLVSPPADPPLSGPELTADQRSDR